METNPSAAEAWKRRGQARAALGEFTEVLMLLSFVQFFVILSCLLGFVYLCFVLSSVEGTVSIPLQDLLLFIEEKHWY